YYASMGLITCLVIQSHDPTVEFLIGRKIGNTPPVGKYTLHVVQLESTKITGEELGMLRGMDPFLAIGALEKLIQFIGGTRSTKELERKFDVIVYDGISSEETLWMKGSSAFANPLKFSCYLVMDPSNCMSVKVALRYWGCAIQAGTNVSGAFYLAFASNRASNKGPIEENFFPLATASVPFLSMDFVINWGIAINNLNEDARKFLTLKSGNSRSISPVTFDQTKKTLTLFLPRFDKSDIRLSQV
ncbi:hypothetical protein KI387_015155, partial [Taxus chinensis]